MNWRAMAVIGAATGAAAAWAVRRQARQDARENARWAEATDTVAPTATTATAPR